MVESVSPTYYAANTGTSSQRYVVHGRNFNLWPEIVATRASENDNPKRFLHDSSVYNVYVLVSRTDTELVFEFAEPQTNMPASYLGCIADAQRTALWVNQSRPLP